jgi:hypothetical protein
MRSGLAPSQLELLTSPFRQIIHLKHGSGWNKNGLKQYFEYFGDLAIHLDEYFGELTAHVNDAKSEIEPDTLTIGQLISALKPDQFWQVVTAVALVVLVALGLGAWLGLPHFW